MSDNIFSSTHIANFLSLSTTHYTLHNSATQIFHYSACIRGPHIVSSVKKVWCLVWCVVLVKGDWVCDMVQVWSVEWNGGAFGWSLWHCGGCGESKYSPPLHILCGVSHAHGTKSLRTLFVYVEYI